MTEQEIFEQKVNEHRDFYENHTAEEWVAHLREILDDLDKVIAAVQEQGTNWQKVEYLWCVEEMEDQVKRNEENLSPLVLARACEQLFYNMVGTNEEDTIQEKQKWHAKMKEAYRVGMERGSGDAAVSLAYYELKEFPQYRIEKAESFVESYYCMTFALEHGVNDVEQAIAVLKLVAGFVALTKQDRDHMWRELVIRYDDKYQNSALAVGMQGGFYDGFDLPCLIALFYGAPTRKETGEIREMPDYEKATEYYKKSIKNGCQMATAFYYNMICEHGVWGQEIRDQYKQSGEQLQVLKDTIALHDQGIHIPYVHMPAAVDLTYLNLEQEELVYGARFVRQVLEDYESGEEAYCSIHAKADEQLAIYATFSDGKLVTAGEARERLKRAYKYYMINDPQKCTRIESSMIQFPKMSQTGAEIMGVPFMADIDEAVVRNILRNESTGSSPVRVGGVKPGMSTVDTSNKTQIKPSEEGKSKTASQAVVQAGDKTKTSALIAGACLGLGLQMLRCSFGILWWLILLAVGVVLCFKLFKSMKEDQKSCRMMFFVSYAAGYVLVAMLNGAFRLIPIIVQLAISYVIILLLWKWKADK